MSFIFITKRIKIGAAIINSLKQWLLTIYVKQFIVKWHQQNKDYRGNKRFFLKQYFRMLIDKCIDEYYREEKEKAVIWPTSIIWQDELAPIFKKLRGKK